MTTADLALVRGVFLNVIQASETLGIDAGFRAKVKAALDRLPPYKIGSRGQSPGVVLSTGTTRIPRTATSRT